MMKPSIRPIDVIDSVQKNAAAFVIWDADYLYTGVYDLQEEYIREDLKSWGFDYDKG